MHVTVLMNLKTLMLSERSQTRNVAYDTIPLPRGSRELQRQKAEEQALEVGKSER